MEWGMAWNFVYWNISCKRPAWGRWRDWPKTQIPCPRKKTLKTWQETNRSITTFLNVLCGLLQTSFILIGQHEVKIHQRFAFGNHNQKLTLDSNLFEEAIRWLGNDLDTPCWNEMTGSVQIRLLAMHVEVQSKQRAEDKRLAPTGTLWCGDTTTKRKAQCSIAWLEWHIDFELVLFLCNNVHHDLWIPIVDAMEELPLKKFHLAL